MSYEDDPGTRTAGRLAALAMARACAEAMTAGRPLDEGAGTAAGLFLAGRPDSGPGGGDQLPDEVVWLLGAGAQVAAAALWAWARCRAGGRDPTAAEVTAVCDELEAGLIRVAG